MKKSVFWALLAVLCMSISVLGTTYCPTALGAGSDPPTGVCVNYSGTGATFTWTTTTASDSEVFLMHDGDLSEPGTSRAIYNPTKSIHHSVSVTGLNPTKTYGFYVASCPTGSPQCPRTSSDYSYTPDITQIPMWQFTMPDTSPTDSFDWVAYMSGPHEGPYLQHSYNFPVNGYKTDGPTPDFTYLVNAKIDGQSCFPLSIAGANCGTTHIKFQFVCSYAEIVDSTRNNYASYVVNTGPYAGDGFCYNPNTDYESNQARVTPDSMAATGSHSIELQLIQTKNGAQVGSAQTVDYTFNVLATPSISASAPMTIPAIPNIAAWWANIVGTDLGTGHSTLGLITNYEALQTANITLPGVYSNDNASSFIYDFNPTGILTYRGGDQVPFTIYDLLYSVTASFQANHSYSYGDKFCTNGGGGCHTDPNDVLIVTNSTGCTSGASLGTVPAIGGFYTNGTCTIGNAGNSNYWLEAAERADDQHRDFELLQGQYTIWQEWNNFPDITAAQRRNSSPSTSLNAIGIGYSMYPFITGNGANQTQSAIYSVREGMDTLRSLPYQLEDFVSWWILTGTKPVDGGVDEIAIREDMIIQMFKDMQTYSLIDGVNSTYACCMSYPSFDIGLGLEALIEACDVSILKTSTCDPVVEQSIGDMLDWTYAHEFNLLGNDYSMPYSPLTIPYNTHNNKTPGLNNLVAPAFAWWWALIGDSCTLPTSGVACLTAGDNFASHTFDNGNGDSHAGVSSKIAAEWYKWWEDYYEWRTGARTYDEISILPAYNSLVSMPNVMEPFPQGSFPSEPVCTAVSSSEADCVWYGFGTDTSDTPAPFLKYDIGTVCTPGLSGSTVAGSATSQNSTIALWKYTAAITGLSPNTQYCVGFGTTGSNGKTGYTENRISTNHPWNVTTLPVNLQINGTLGNGIQGVFYTSTLTGANGSLPYNFSTTRCVGVACTGNDVAGLSMSSSGTYSGIPSKPGTASVSVRLIDGVGTVTNKVFLVTIAPASQGGSNTIKGLHIFGIKIF